MWRVGLAFTLLLAMGGLYETWAIAYRPRWTITELTRRHVHLAIIVGGSLFTLFGYVLGLGGQ